LGLIEELGNVLWYILPAYLASLSPVWFRLRGETRLDFGMSFRGRPILGESKTVRGFIGGALVGSFLGLLQEIIFGRVNGFVLGILLGIGAMTGDAVKSFFKRQLDIKPGEPWIPFDQIDFLIGALVFSSLVEKPSFLEVLLLLLVTPFLHFLSNLIHFRMGLKEVPY
jgi:CDP-2,3-bis-(O-geranylgeranyl)-sn-glycerol synthase